MKLPLSQLIIPICASAIITNMRKYIALTILTLFLLSAALFAVKNTERTEAPADLPVSGPSDDTPLNPNDPVGGADLGPCYVGGCSSQLCSDQPDMASTCEFREEYSCYQTAKCERQRDGQCGWTDTPELSMCLNSARQ